MDGWLESVPNFSEGRDREVICSILQAIEQVPGVFLLHWDADRDHNRTVVTLAGPGEQVVEACFQAARKALELIDLRRHEGVHPRTGAVDVIPLIPLGNTSSEEAQKWSRELGRRLGEELELPVFLYAESAPHGERKRLADLRRGGLEGLARRMREEPLWRPDFGPSAPHPTGGVCAVGVRDFLIAYNVLLQSQDLKLARRIARKVRRRQGVLALAFPLASRQQVQVSMNVVDFRSDSLGEVFEEIAKEAGRGGVTNVESELVGLIPLEAVCRDFRRYLKLPHFSSERVIEAALWQKLSRSPTWAQSLYVSALASSRPTPGGGSAAASVGALGSALLAMALELGREEGATPSLRQKAFTLLHLAVEDEKAYQQVLKKGLSREEKNRAIEQAARIPLQVLQTLCEVLELAKPMLAGCKASLQPDVAAALYILKGGFSAAREMVCCNLEWLKKRRVSTSLEEELEKLDYLWQKLCSFISISSHKGAES